MADFTKYGNIIKSAPVAMCVFLDKDAIYDRDKDILAVGACIQNMLLQAYLLGIGNCWLGEILNRKKEVNISLGIKENFELLAVVTLRYPAKGKQKSSRKKLEDFILTDSFSVEPEQLV